MKINQPNLFSPVIAIYLLNLTFNIMALRSKRKLITVKLKPLS